MRTRPRLGEALGLPESELRDVYYFGLLRFIGCNSDTHAIAALLVDELNLRSAFAGVDTGSPPQVLNLTIGTLSESQLDTACQVLADLADIKSPYMLGHSPAVAKYVSAAARLAGLNETEAGMLWRAGLLQSSLVQFLV